MVKSYSTRPVGGLVLHKFGESHDRIAKQKRVIPYADIERLENLIIKNSELPITADILPFQPPFFTEFTYCDVFGGILVTTLSPEINYRVIENLDTPEENWDIPCDKLIFGDKYQQPLPKDSSEDYPEKVIFMTGSNLFMKTVDLNKLDDVMSDESWYLKPHPLTNDQHLREYGIKYGYDRIIDKDLSAESFYLAAKQVGILATSQLCLRAVLDDKPYVDFTNFASRYAHCYATFFEYSKTMKGGGNAFKRLLFNPASGFLFPGLPDEDNLARLRAFQTKALSERERFRMKTKQQLMVRIKSEPQVPKTPPMKKD